jgi:hypothetical protein
VQHESRLSLEKTAATRRAETVDVITQLETMRQDHVPT